MRGAAALLLALCGCPECTRPPAFADNRTVSRDEACKRIETALRAECEPNLQFDCAAFYTRDGKECTGDQRESDVERCEELIARARDCDEALAVTCGVSCDDGSHPPRI